MEFLKRKKYLLLLLPFLFSFRLFLNHNPWKINNNSEESRKIFVSYTNATTNVDNDLGSSDPAASASSSLSVETLMDSIFDDFNNIDAAYVTLVDTDDADYDASKKNRIIKITFGGASGTSSGEASFSYGSDGKIDDSGCKISGESDLLKSAENFVSTMTHEIGHCLGLAHSQEITQSIMSYYASDDIIRLQDDDMMGIIYLYAKDPSKASEDNTLGLSCSRR